MRKRELVTAACWTLLGLIISVWSATFPFGSWDEVGPGVLPFGTGVILFVLGILFFLQVWRREEDQSKLSPLVPGGAALRRLLACVGGMLVSSVLLGVLGFMVTVFFLTLFLLRGIQAKMWRTDVSYALLFTVSCYVLFQVVFKTTLPKGFLGF
jgi:hypothetical protein